MLFQALESPLTYRSHITSSETSVWPLKIHNAFGTLHACMMHKHEIVHSAWVTGKFRPEAKRHVFNSPIKGIPSSAVKQIKAYFASTSTLLCTCFTAHTEAWNTFGNTEERGGEGRPRTYSLQVTGSNVKCVNFASASIWLRRVSEDMRHVLWMSWKGWKPREEDGERLITQRWNHRTERAYGATLLFFRETP